MSSFKVTTAAVGEASARLGGISGGVSDLHGRLAAHSGAGMGTPADGALEGLLGHWAQVLPVFALSSERLSAAVGSAALSYAGSDAAIGASCGVASNHAGKR
ncbi:MAG: hypothetical protein WCB67_04540 [Solirubrobacteraceae bacterium]